MDILKKLPNAKWLKIKRFIAQSFIYFILFIYFFGGGGSSNSPQKQFLMYLLCCCTLSYTFFEASQLYEDLEIFER